MRSVGSTELGYNLSTINDGSAFAVPQGGFG
jgi:hypothetical protein